MPTTTQPLQGEELAWYEVAFRLGKTVGELKELVTQTEFEGWLEFLKIERDRNTKEHFYLAQIAAEIRRSIVTNPKEIQINSFLLHFATKEEIEQTEQEPVATKTLASKKRWALALGMNIDLN